MKIITGLQFESSVVLDGTKTNSLITVFYIKFESSVVLDGTKTESVLPEP